MKIALICHSLLLTKSLEIFLKNNITTYKKCDFVISDKKLDIDKPQFIISGESADLDSPFSESALIIELEKFYNNNILSASKDTKTIIPQKIDLEEKIDFITKKFRDDLVSVIKGYYEK